MTTTKQYFKVKNGLEFPRQDALTVTDDGGPSIRPSLLLDFAKTKKLDPRITFSRPTTATYYDGKTVVKAEENLVTYSQEFDNAAWVKSGVTVSANTATAPDGTSTADSLKETTGTTTHFTRTAAFTPNPGQVYILSVYAKYVDMQYFVVNAFLGSTSYASAFFDIQNGSVTSYGTQGSGWSHTQAPTITNVGNGWYRCSISIISGAATFYSAFSCSNSPTLSSGNGGMPADYVGSLKSAYIWGAQLEQRSTVTAYTPTTTAPITNYIPALQTAVSNDARFDHDPVTGESKGLLIEEQRTNLAMSYAVLAYPQTMTNIGISQNCAVAPDGTNSAALIYATAPTQNFFYRWHSVTNGSTYTHTIYAKAAGLNYFYIFDINNAYNNVWYNLSNGTTSTPTTGSATITHVGNGWYKCTQTTTASSTNGWFGIGVSAASGQVSTTTNSNMLGVLFWGPQLEAGSFATSYIPTPLTYTGRASTGTYKATDGLIRTAQPNVARYEPNASGGSNLLLEGAGSNLFIYTDKLSISNWSSVRGTTVTNAVQAPDGQFSGCKFVEDTSAATSHEVYSFVTKAASSQTYTFSIYAKAAERYRILLLLDSTIAGGYSRATFNLNTGVVDSGNANGTFGGYSASITAVGGGWYRCSLTGTSDTDTRIYGECFLDNGTTTTYTGDGTSGIYIWGAQLETGSTATSYIPSVETFTGRSANVASYYDSTGVIRYAGSGVPRYTYNPSNLNAAPKLLLEPAATNLLTYSQLSSGWLPNSSTTLTDNSTTAPDGTVSAMKLSDSSSSILGYFYQNSTFTSGQAYTVSIYAKAITAKTFFIRSFQQDGTAAFDLTNGTVVVVGAPGIAANPNIQNLGNGWYRCSVTFVATASGSNNIGFGDYDILTTGDLFYVWGAQLETGYAPTSYIPTTSAQVTRAADTSTSVAGSRAADVYSSSQVTRSADFTSIIGSNYTTWFRNDEGTFYTDTTSFGLGSGATRVIEASNGAANTISLMYTSAGAYSYNSDVNSMGVSNGVSIAGKAVYALAYKTNDAALCTNGGSVSTDTSVQLPNGLSRLDIGHSTYYTPRQLNGTIKKIAYYPKRLSNTELQSITS